MQKIKIIILYILKGIDKNVRFICNGLRLRFPISFTPDISESLKNIKNFVFILNIKGNNGIPSLGYCIPSLGYSIIYILH